jgi:hypothetical protein
MIDRRGRDNRDINEGKGSLTVSLREPPLPHFVRERKRGFGEPGFLSPGQGERWHAKHDGEGVLLHRCQFPTRHT